MALSTLATQTRPARHLVPLATLVDGDIVVPDSGFTCMLPGQGHTVRIDPMHGPYVSCCCARGRGRHYLDDQTDASGMVVGMRRYRPAPVPRAAL